MRLYSFQKSDILFSPLYAYKTYKGKYESPPNHNNSNPKELQSLPITFATKWIQFNWFTW